MIKAIIFDAEGVVIDSETIWDESQRVFLEKRGIKYNREKLKHLLTGQSMIDGVRTMKKLYGKKLKGAEKDLARERIEITYNLFKTKINFIDGFEKFYKKIKENYQTCIATSINKKLLNYVNNKLNLEKLFDNKIFSIEDVENKSKPDPAIFLYSSKKLKVNPKECLVIEDSPTGILAAKRAGMYCVGIATTYKKDKLKKADQIVSSFSKISIPKN